MERKAVYSSYILVCAPYHHDGIHASVGGWEIFKRGSKVRVGKIKKIIHGLPIEVGFEILMSGVGYCETFSLE